jgi:phospholipase/lecithinase/hemolysin
LFFVFIGGNDVRDAGDEIDDVAALSILTDAVNGIGLGIRALVTMGAKAILIVNVPELGLIPEARKPGDAQLASHAARLSIQFNTLLSEKIAEIERELGLDLVDFNLFGYSHFIASNNLALGFTNDADACFSSVSLTFNPACDSGMNFEKFVFFDEVHPTARAHERIGRALFTAVPVPINDTSPGGVWSAKDEDRSTYAGYVQSMGKAGREKRLGAWGVTTALIGRLLAFRHDLAYVPRLLPRAIEQSIPGRL